MCYSQQKDPAGLSGRQTARAAWLFDALSSELVVRDLFNPPAANGFDISGQKIDS
jgi:hypothetical protein